MPVKTRVIKLRKLGWAAALAAAILGVALTAGPARAGVIFDADASPSGSASDTFDGTGGGNCDTGTISRVSDAAHGSMWRFHKPSGSERCEARGIRVGGEHFEFGNNATYYLGWQFMLSDISDNNAVFQWKSYGDHIQNFPVVLKMIDGRLTMLQRQPEKRDFLPWSRPIKANTWNHVALGIHTSDELTGGWVEVYFNGVPQRFTNGATRWPARTWDSSNDPKWGVYGATDTTITNLVDRLRVGTTLADVRAPVARPAAGPTTPAPTPTAAPAPSPTATPTPQTAPVLAAEPGGPGRPDTTGTAGNTGFLDITTVAILVAGLGLTGIAVFTAVRMMQGRRRPRHAVARRAS